jgi:hypothetical protein
MDLFLEGSRNLWLRFVLFLRYVAMLDFMLGRRVGFIPVAQGSLVCSSHCGNMISIDWIMLCTWIKKK